MRTGSGFGRSRVIRLLRLRPLAPLDASLAHSLSLLLELKSDSGRSVEQPQQRRRIGDSSSTVTEEPLTAAAVKGMLAMTDAVQLRRDEDGRS